jgi:threonine/homoserine/homoserine lactone efflux protein
MVAALIVGVVAGFVTTIAPGPIAIAVMKNAVQGNKRTAYDIAIGAAIMDVLFALMAAFASSAIVTALINLVNSLGWLKVLLQVVCIAILVVLGIRYFRATTTSVAASSSREQQQEEKAQRMGLSSPVFIGILLGLMNVATPTFLPSLIGIMTFLHANRFTGSWIGFGVWDNAFLALGFGTGALLWLLVLASLLNKYRSRLPSNFISYIYRFGGSAFVLFAIVLAYHVLMSTTWSELW